MTLTLDSFTKEEIEQAKEEIVAVLLEYVDKEDIRVTPTQILNHLIRKENGK